MGFPSILAFLPEQVSIAFNNAPVEGTIFGVKPLLLSSEFSAIKSHVGSSKYVAALIIFGRENCSSRPTTTALTSGSISALL